MRRIVLRFGTSLFVVCLIVLIGKFAVDTCLPARGSVVFPKISMAPGKWCEGLSQWDSQGRRDQATLEYGTADLSTVLAFEFTHPTIVLSGFPRNGRAFRLVVSFIFAAAFLIFLAWMVVADVVGLIMALAIPDDLPPGATRRRITATFVLLGGGGKRGQEKDA